MSHPASELFRRLERDRALQSLLLTPDGVVRSYPLAVLLHRLFHRGTERKRSAVLARISNPGKAPFSGCLSDRRNHIGRPPDSSFCFGAPQIRGLKEKSIPPVSRR